MDELGQAFSGTAQPLPGQGTTTIWYLAQGYQTHAGPGEGVALHRLGDRLRRRCPRGLPTEAADTGHGPGVDQAMQLADAVGVAYCQPSVGAYFNFHLTDERDLAGWQSGVFWPDGSPKAAYQALHRTAGEVNARSIDCSSFSPDGAPPRPAAVQQPAQQLLEDLDLHSTVVSAFGATLDLADDESRPACTSATGSSATASRPSGRPVGPPAAPGRSRR